MRIAISGHRGLPAPVQALVDRAIRAALAGQAEVTGLSCLADGPDQIFARAVLDHGGQIEAQSDGHGTGSTFSITLPCCRRPLDGLPTPTTTSTAGVELSASQDD